jgi:Gas vesicle synthesis protein GvpL/GvpF/Lsr2
MGPRAAKKQPGNPRHGYAAGRPGPARGGQSRPPAKEDPVGIMVMASRTQVMLACDVCGNEKNVATRTFGLDGKTYEIDLCPKDDKGLSKTAAGYISKARKTHGRKNSRRGGRKPRSRAEARGKAPDSEGTADGPEKGIRVYGVMPADVEVAAGTPGVGDHAGPLRLIRSGDLAALVSEVELPGKADSPDDLRAYREILDATATEVPVLPLPFGTHLADDKAVTRELLAAHHDELAAALDRLEDRVQFLVQGRYAGDAAQDGAASANDRAAQRREDTRALEQAMKRACVASAPQRPRHDLDAVQVAFLVPVSQEGEAEQVVDELAKQWEGRIDIQLLGPMAPYEFVDTEKLFPPGGGAA